MGWKWCFFWKQLSQGEGDREFWGYCYSIFSVQTKINMLKTTRQRSEKSEKGTASVKTTTGHTPSFFLSRFVFYVSVCVIFVKHCREVNRANRKQPQQQQQQTTRASQSRSTPRTIPSDSVDDQISPRRRGSPAAKKTKKKRKKKKQRGQCPPAESTGL